MKKTEYDDIDEYFEERPPEQPKYTSTLRALVDLRERVIQKNRIAFDLRLGAIKRGADQANPEQIAILQRWSDHFHRLENEVNDDITAESKGYVIIKYLTDLRGVGNTIATRMVALIDIQRAESVSKLWRYCGLAVIDGKAERSKKGETSHYNHRLKSLMWVLAGSLLRTGSPYRKVYDQARQYYAENRPDWIKKRQHMASLRKMNKVFLSHLWVTWRKLEGLPTRNLYVEDYLGHTEIAQPEDFGWLAVQ